MPDGWAPELGSDFRAGRRGLSPTALSLQAPQHVLLFVIAFNPVIIGRRAGFVNGYLSPRPSSEAAANFAYTSGRLAARS